jgi:uncharacterized membrane protein YphA (DoxX/SURF4 family)
VAAASGVDRERWAARYARVALAAAFLSAVAGRFGLWGGHLDWTAFTRFIARTGELNAFMPPAAMPFLAWGATIAETTFAISLLAGFRLRWVALGSAVLLAWFGTAMAFADGPKAPLDYSVFSASAAALLLFLQQRRT